MEVATFELLGEMPNEFYFRERKSLGLGPEQLFLREAGARRHAGVLTHTRASQGGQYFRKHMRSARSASFILCYHSSPPVERVVPMSALNVMCIVLSKGHSISIAHTQGKMDHSLGHVAAVPWLRGRPASPWSLVQENLQAQQELRHTTDDVVGKE